MTLGLGSGVTSTLSSGHSVSAMPDNVLGFRTGVLNISRKAPLDLEPSLTDHLSGRAGLLGAAAGRGGRTRFVICR
jgi:hypothetical protein